MADLCREVEEGAGWSWTWTPDKVKEHWDDFVVLDGGFIKFRPIEHCLHIDLVYVPEEGRRKGLGRTLVGLAEQVGRDTGKIASILESPVKSPFWEALGYKVMGEIPNFYFNVNGILYGKVLKDENLMETT